ncbi:MAG: PPE family protein [Mycobacterium sp.]
MTAPVWMASPPEMHSALLSSGPGPGSLLAAAGAWISLSAEYASAAEELSAVLGAVQAGVWEGLGAESYVAAYVPYLAWLMQASVNSAAAAAQHETAAAAYTGALAAMPTLAELAANHAIHAVLVATNFFGINTIQIAVNEADYVRMWIQAATTMATYQAVSSTAVASTPQTTPPPQILKSEDSTSAQTAAQGQAAQSGFSTGLGDQLESLVDRLGLGPLVDPLAIDHIFDFLNNPVLATEQAIEHFFNALLTNPLGVLQNPLFLFFDGDELFFPFGQLIPPSLAIAPVGSVGGFAGLAELAAGQPAAMPAVAPALAPVGAAPETVPVAAMAPTLAAAGAAPATAPATAPAPAASTVAGSAPPSAPPAAGVQGVVYPYVVGPPGIGFGSGMRTSASASAKKKAPQPDTAAAAASAAAREQARARRRRRAKLRGYGDEFMDMNVEVDRDWGAPAGVGVPPACGGEPAASTVASGQGGGPLGFAGTVRKETAEAAGLTTLAGDEFGGGPAMPMMPGTWDSDQSDESGDE